MREWTQDEIDDQNEYDGDCGNCGGEGYTFDCWDGFCESADYGCKACTHRCDWCNPAPQSKTTEALRQILADALEGKLAATHTYMDDDKVVIREVTASEFYLPGPVNVTPDTSAERTKVESQASGHDRVEPSIEQNLKTQSDGGKG